MLFLAWNEQNEGICNKHVDRAKTTQTPAEPASRAGDELTGNRSIPFRTEKRAAKLVGEFNFIWFHFIYYFKIERKIKLFNLCVFVDGKSRCLSQYSHNIWMTPAGCNGSDVKFHLLHCRSHIWHSIRTGYRVRRFRMAVWSRRRLTAERCVCKLNCANGELCHIVYVWTVCSTENGEQWAMWRPADDACERLQLWLPVRMIIGGSLEFEYKIEQVWTSWFDACKCWELVGESPMEMLANAGKRLQMIANG